ncbi:MAG: ATP-binding protein [Kiritimatiellia bacterium]|nr:4Fe-4S binding protein [Lentisphaerota bacterium]
MKRSMIVIDREKCNGCGKCISACVEGALQLVDGKATLVKEEYCDGLGACIGDCPVGALRIEEREAPAFQEPPGMQAAQTKQAGPQPGAGHVCPGMQVRSAASADERPATPAGGLAGSAIPSELRQWPVQLHLVPPSAPFLQRRELLLLSACGPVASADAHWRFLRGRPLVMACPKLNDYDDMRDRLAAIIEMAQTPALLVVRMEVPCCRGLMKAAQAAAEQAGRPDLPIREVVLGLNGDVLE